MSNNTIYLCSAGLNDEVNGLQQAATIKFPNKKSQVVTIKNQDFDDTSVTGNIMTLSIAGLDYPDPNSIARAFYEYFKDIANPIILMYGNRYNNSIAARMTAALGAVIVSDVDEIIIEQEHLNAVKKAYSGALKQNISVPSNSPVIFTLSSIDEDQTGVLNQDTNIQNMTMQLDLKLPQATEFKSLSNDNEVDLADAQLVVAGGRGVKDENEFNELYKFAKNIDAAVGASRPVVDAGWVDNSAMIGQSGKTIAPTAYFAFGISGTIQHTIGIEKAKYIIAINNDKEAPIFQIADYGVVGDAKSVIQALIEKTTK